MNAPISSLVFAQVEVKNIMQQEHSAQPQIHIFKDSPFRYTSIDAWTTENGLPHNAILDLLQTRDGYIWFGSFNGVLRFDGNHFRLWRRSNTPLLGSNTVAKLYEDSHQNLWLGVQEGGIVAVQNSGKMIRLDSTYGFRDNMISAWTEDLSTSSSKCGTVYFAANKGIYAISHDLLKNTFSLYHDSIYNQNISEVALDILIDRRSGFWTATRKGLYYRPSRSNPHTLRLFDTSNGLPNIRVECLYEDRSGTVWIGTRRGVCRFTNGVLIQDAALRTLSPAHDFIEDKSGNLWIGTDSGLVLWAKNSPSPKLYSLTTEQGLTDNSVRTLLEDVEGNIWIGTYYGGLNRLKYGMFSNLNMRDGLIGEITYAALEARDGAVWIGSFNGAQRITSSKTFTLTTQNGLLSPIVRCFAEDSTGNIWIGTYGALHVYSSEGRIKTYTIKDGLVDDQIRNLCVARDGTLWIGTASGMSSFKNGVFTSFTVKNGGIPSNSTLGVIQDRAGNIWISTNGGGVMIFNPVNGKKSYLQPNIHLPSDDAFQVSESPTSDEIWIPCNGGFTMWKNGTATIFTMHDGLPDENVFHIMEDSAGMLWMTCNIGIFSVSKYDVLRCAKERFKLSCTLYTKSDGLQTNSCNVPSFVCRTRAGEFWIPMQKGISILNPAKHQQNKHLPEVRCEAAVVDSITTIFTSINRIITAIAGAERITFQFTALSLTAPEKNEFRYMLEGFDKHWVVAGTSRSAVYTHLAPGTYTFRVIASNNSGVWNITGDSVTVVVQAYFYQTLWFYGLCGILVLAFGYGVLRYRTWRLKARAQVLENMVHERTKQIEEHSEEIDRQNIEIKRQLEILDHQAREIELVNTTLNEKNIHLLEANTTLENANAEIQRQQHILEYQAADIELANAELQERNSQLQTLNQEKNEFLGIATHDLKNPLAAIRMTVSLIQKYYDRMSKDDVLERLGAVETSSERMTSIITNLLDINAIESGKFNVSLADIDLNELTKMIVEEYRERAEAKKLALYFISPNDSIFAHADRNVTLEVLDNLISNAVKYSPFDRNIYVRLIASNDKVRIEIQDEGPGLSEEDKAKLFGKFMRLTARPTGGEHSTGLGLSIVKRMVEAMDGKVWCETELGKGATFIVELPKSEGKRTVNGQ